MVFSALTTQAQTITANNLEKHVYTLADDNMEGRGFGSEAGNRAAEYIKNQLIAAGVSPLSDTGYYHHFSHRVSVLNINGKNVVGLIKGNNPELNDEFIVIGAHYDHIGYQIDNDEKIVYNGADDNATGVGAMIEIAKALVMNKQKLGRSVVVVAFDGEESGLIGSKHFVEDELIPPHKIKCMFSLDMLGMYEKAQMLEMKGAGTLSKSEKLLNEIALKQGITVSKMSNNVVSRTDTRYFGAKGIPAIHATTGTLSPYHKPEDDPNLIDYRGMEQISEYLYQVIVELSNKDQLNSEIKPIAETEKALPLFDWGVRINLGSSQHNYPDNFFTGKALFAADAGLFGQINMHKNFTLQPELVYQTMGSKSFMGNIRTHSVSVPVNLLLSSIPDENYGNRLFVIVGGYYSYTFYGKQGNTEMDIETVFDPNEYGINYGIGFGNKYMQMSVYMKNGLSNLYQNNNTGNILNRGTYFSVGIKL